MKWVEIIGTHVNMNLVETFVWHDGQLHVFFHGDNKVTKVDDPDQELYLKMCRSQGIQPYEEEA